MLPSMLTIRLKANVLPALRQKMVCLGSIDRSILLCYVKVSNLVVMTWKYNWSHISLLCARVCGCG